MLDSAPCGTEFVKVRFECGRHQNYTLLKPRCLDVLQVRFIVVGSVLAEKQLVRGFTL